MDAAAAARAWVEGWSKGWPAQDAEAIAALYAEDASFRSHPFREPHRGAAGVRDYCEWAFADEERPTECWFGEPRFTAGGAVVEYWAIITSEGKEHTLAGISVLDFAADGRVQAQRDYWSMEEGRRERPAGWGVSS
jgi:ketosteroid isomerase-like protein